MEADFIARIDAAWNDVDALWVIEQELKGISEPWGRKLHLRAVLRRTNLQKAMNGDPAAPHWLTRYGLERPDGRPLHQYRVVDASFERIQADLTARAQVMQFGASHRDAALFVIWASEWFRRRYRGDMQRWADLGGPIGLHLEQAGWRKLADDGLRYWKIEALRVHGIHHRLVAIARQGGFPVAALEGGAGGWASRYLQHLVRRLLGETEPTVEIAARLAGELDDMVPETWRNEEMRAVSAELALAAVQLRREAEAGGISNGALVSAWLDQHRPPWRDELPLAIDAEGARALVDGLLSVAPLRGGGGAIRAQRILTIDQTGRREGLELMLDGILQASEGDSFLSGLANEWSRLRVFASGALARHVAGELAIAEPSDEGQWTSRPVSPRLRFEVPFGVPVTLELWGEGRRVAGPFVPTGGEPLSQGLLVCSSDGEGEPPSELRVVGLGSGGYRAEPLYLDVPLPWTVAPNDADAEVGAETTYPESTGRRLWRVTGAALVRGSGDSFLVRPGQSGDQRDRIVMSADVPSGCSLADGSALRCGAPKLTLIEGARKRAARAGETWWRRKGDREWIAYSGAPSAGLCEFAWRDASTGHMRARVEATVLPGSFAISRKRSGDWIELTVSGWPHEVSIPSGQKAGPGTWRFEIAGSNRSHCEIHLTQPNAPAIAVQARLPHLAWISHWQDGPVPRNGRLSVSTLHRYVARAQGRCELVAELFDLDNRPIRQGFASWMVEDELPLSLIVDDVAALLRPLGRIDARVRLDFHDAHNNHWFVSEFEHDLVSESGGLVPDKAIIDDGARVVGRQLGDPSNEREFGAYGLQEQLNHRPIVLPPLPGAWLVYLRSSDRVLSRPRLIPGNSLSMAETPLGRAMALGDRADRGLALTALADSVVNDPACERSRTIVRSLVDLAVSLDGLPPATFEIFGRLETHPLIGPMMLFTASSEEVEKVLRLADGLSLSWVLIAKRWWDDAYHLEGSRLIELLPDQLATVATVMNARRKALAEYEPSLAPLLGMGGDRRPPTAIANAFLNRSGDRIQTGIRNPFRPDLAEVLPPWGFASDYWRALDAPLAAAKVARGEINDLTLDQMICMRSIARQHPRYFAEAFASAFEGRLG